FRTFLPPFLQKARNRGARLAAAPAGAMISTLSAWSIGSRSLGRRDRAEQADEDDGQINSSFGNSANRFAVFPSTQGSIAMQSRGTTKPAMTSSHPLPVACQWFSRPPSALDRRQVPPRESPRTTGARNALSRYTPPICVSGTSALSPIIYQLASPICL